MEIFHIDEDIRKSETLPSSFYRERAWFERSISEIWEKCWIFIGDNTDQNPVGTLTPMVLLPDVLNPLKSMLVCGMLASGKLPAVRVSPRDVRMTVCMASLRSICASFCPI